MLEAASTEFQYDDDDTEAALVFADLPLAADALFGYLKSVKIAGQVKSENFEFLEPTPKDAFNKLEFLRWYSILFASGFSSGAAQLAKDHTN